MKQQLLLLIFAFFSFSVLGQGPLSFEYVDTDGTIVFENTGNSSQDVVIKGTLTNETSSDIELTWKREVQYIFNAGTSTWETAVCDLNRCYLPFVSQADFTIPANGTSNLDAHLYPSGINGDSAIVIIHLEDKNTGDTLMSVSYNFFEDVSLSGENPTGEVQTLVFPNPAASYFRVKSDEQISSIQIFDILGKPVVDQAARSADVMVNISHLHRGMYIVRIRGAEGQILKTQRLKKDML
jgi:hypothetical protein